MQSSPALAGVYAELPTADGGGFAAKLTEIDSRRAAGDYAGAFGLCQDALWLAPERTELLARAVAITTALGDWRSTLALAQRWVRAEPESAQAYLALGDIQAALGNTAFAESAWRRARRLEPDAPGSVLPNARAIAAGQGGEPTPAYVAALFDGYAKDFDVALARLDYQGPSILQDSLRLFLPDPAKPMLDILDLGCGTGLAGLTFKPYARRLIGVDLSRRMLDIASGRGIYDALHRQEMVSFLITDQARHHLITACDTLIYMGNLGPVLRAAAPRLTEGGHFAATVERLRSEDPAVGYRLEATRRYAHSELHIRESAAAAGLIVTALQPCIIRTEKQQPVEGLAFALAR